MIVLKNKDEIRAMRQASQIVAKILHETSALVLEGATTLDLDKFAESRCKDLGAVPAFKGYHGFPGVLCVSVNEEVVHGIPSAKKVLKEGDIVGVDFGVIYNGWYGDSARTVAVGKISSEALALMNATKEGLFRGIEACQVGGRLFDIGSAVQNYVEERGYSVVREFVGHGIGRSLHEDPQVPNYGTKGKGLLLKEGLVLAIEPMVNQGKPGVRVLGDGWTAVTVDGKLSAHFEHTVAITAGGPEVLTLLDDEG